MKKIIRFCIVLVCILILTVFIANVKIFNNTEISPASIEAETVKFYQFQTENKYLKAIKSLDNIINMTSKLYGQSSFETAQAYLKKAEFAIKMSLYDISKKCIDEAVKISENDSVPVQLKNYIFYTSYNYNFSTGMYQENLKLIEEADKGSVFEAEKTNINNFYGIIYLSLKNDKMAEKYFKKFKNILEGKKQLFQYYQNMTYLCDDINDYKMYRYYLDKAEEAVNNNAAFDKNQKLRNLMAEITYYTAFSKYEDALKLLDENFEYYTKNRNSNNLQEFYSRYYDIYKEKGDYKKAEEYLHKIEQSQKVYPKNSLIHLDTISKRIDLYNEFNNYIKVNNELKKAYELINPVKDYVPAIYAEYLRKDAINKKNSENIAESYKLINMSAEVYKKYFPESSYQYYEYYKDYAEILSYDGKQNEALECYENALKIINNLKGEITVDSADIYESMANIYSLQGNKEQALKYISKATDIYSEVYGENNIKTYEKMLTKYYIYNNFSETEKAKKLIDNMKKNYAENKVEGYKKYVTEQLQ